MNFRKVIALFQLAIGVAASAFTVDGLNYAITSGEAVVTGSANPNATAIVIPATVSYNGIIYNVTAIGKEAFYNCTKAESVVIEDSDLPLKSVWYTNPQGSQVQSRPFLKCPLKSIYLGRNTSTRYSNGDIVGSLPLENSGTDVHVTAGGLSNQVNMTTFYNVDMTTVTLGGNVENVHDNTFSSNRKLRKVTIEHGVNPIFFSQADAFGNCPLDSAIVLRTLGAGTDGLGFYNNKTLKYVECGAPEVIGRSFYCEGLEVFKVLPECKKISDFIGNPGSDIKEIIIEDGSEPLIWDFLTGDLLDSLYIGRSVVCTDTRVSPDFKARTITVGPNLTLIPDHWFSSHSETQEINLPEDLKEIGNRAFYGCRSLTSLNIPNQVTRIGTEAFANCTQLAEFNIPDAVTEIPDNMLENCSSLHGEMRIEDYILKIGQNAFKSTGYSSFIIEDSETPLHFTLSPFYGMEIEYMFFGRQPINDERGYSVLSGTIATLEIGNNVNGLNSTFGLGNRHIRNIVLPDNFSIIGHNMFQACNDLESIVCNANIPPTVNENDGPGFSANNYESVTVTVPTGTKRAYSNDKIWGKFKNIRSDEYIVKTLFDPNSGSVSINGNNINELLVPEGMPVEIKVVPFEGYSTKFIEINGSKIELPTESIKIETLDNDIDVIVEFEKSDTYLNDFEADSFNFEVVDNQLRIYNAGMVAIMDMSGRIMHRNSGSFSINLPSGAYILSNDGAVFKIIL